MKAQIFLNEDLMDSFHDVFLNVNLDSFKICQTCLAVGKQVPTHNFILIIMELPSQKNALTENLHLLGHQANFRVQALPKS